MIDCKICWNELTGQCFCRASEYFNQDVKQGVERCVNYDPVEMLEERKEDGE